MNKDDKVYIAGHRGLVGASILEELKRKGYTNIVTRTHSELDLTNQAAVRDFFKLERPKHVIDAAARVGGIKANLDHPAEFLYENLEIQNNLMWSSKEYAVDKFVFIGSSCIYPKEVAQPIGEDSFNEGRPEAANEAYAYAKISGIKLCEYISTEYGCNFISCTPTNIYGEGSNFDLETAHVIPSLIRRIHEAKQIGQPEVVVWGTGNSRREFLHTDDLASAVVWLLENYNDKQFLNIGTGEDIPIKDLAYKIKDLVGYKGEISFDTTKPDGVPRRLLDVSRLHDIGWHHKIHLDDGLKRTYTWYLNNIAKEL